MRAASQHSMQIGDRRIDYRVIHSNAARHMRIRVGLEGVDVVKPSGRSLDDVQGFLNSQMAWLSDQLARVERLRGVRKADQFRAGQILFRGYPIGIRVEIAPSGARSNFVTFTDGELVIRRGRCCPTPIARSLENWLRKCARAEIDKHLEAVTAKLGQRPDRVYIVDQRTKWANCSARRNLSFNWRLILAPEFVLRYLVTHEAVHLAIPDHSAKFWLTVQSLCRETERARQWLCANGHKLTIDLENVLRGATRFDQH